MKQFIYPGILSAAILIGIIETGESATWRRTVTIQSARGTAYRSINGNYGGGRINRQATTTTAAGRTLTNNTSVTRTASGWTVSGQYTNGVGGKGYYSSNVSHVPGATTKNQQLTTALGETYQRNVRTTYSDGVVNRTVTRTNPNGTTQSRTLTITQN
jgi:hypothetical protein